MTREERAARERKNGGGYYGSGIEVFMMYLALIGIVGLVTRWLF